nr:DsbA family protein [uncultured Ligilactobacillus sp.]
MLEVYLFINPISETCYQTEKKIINLLNESNYKIRFRVLPLLTLSTVNYAMEHIGLPCVMRNQIVDTLYHASLDYEAALFQGQKRGRDFLINIQECTLRNNFKYSEKMVRNVAQISHLDWKIFEEDRKSKLAVKTFRKDQQIAAEMNISTYPTVVLTNTKFPDYAFSLDPWKSFDELKQLILQPDNFANFSTNCTQSQFLRPARLKE